MVYVLRHLPLTDVNVRLWKVLCNVCVDINVCIENHVSGDSNTNARN